MQHKDLDYEKLSDVIEHIDLSQIDTEDLNFRLLKGKFDLSKLIKPIDINKVSKINKVILELNKEQDFFIDLKLNLQYCKYHNSDYVKRLVVFLKKNIIEELSFYIGEQENELKIIKGVL